MKHLLTAIIFICLFSTVTKAQMWNDPMPTKHSYGHKNMTLNDIDGSPYLDTEYKTGIVVSDKGEVYKDIQLRYNCYDDVLEFKKDGVAYDLIPKDKVERAEFGGQVFKYLEFEPGGNANKAYFVILADGKATLCGRYIITFYEEEPVKGFADPKPARFDGLVETFWISVNKGPAKKILNNKKVFEIFEDKKTEMQTYISKQKLSVKKMDDLRKIVNYYNTL